MGWWLLKGAGDSFDGLVAPWMGFWLLWWAGDSSDGLVTPCVTNEGPVI